MKWNRGDALNIKGCNHRAHMDSLKWRLITIVGKTDERQSEEKTSQETPIEKRHAHL